MLRDVVIVQIVEMEIKRKQDMTHMSENSNGT